MIPRADVEINWDVEYPTLREASADELEYGGFATRRYACVLVTDATWEQASELLVEEREAVARVASSAHDEAEFDELAQEEEESCLALEDPNEGFVTAPDLGMFAASVALCAAGCATSASCRGHRGPHAWSDHPVIQFMADSDRARIVEQVSREAGCGLASTEGRLILWAQSIEEVMRLTELLIERRVEFEGLPLPIALREARRKEPPPPAQRSHEPTEGQDTLF